jgi:DNA-binding CsgD family transcriptional regulator
LRVAALHERVLLVEAGPGWGKTSAVRAAFPEAPYVEVPLGQRSGSMHAAVLAALGLSAADAGRIVSRLLTDPESVADAVINALPARTMLVIDDVQRLESEGRVLIEALVEAGVHLVLVGRSMAALPVGAWISRGRAGMPLGPDTLAFRADDVGEVLGDLVAGDELAGQIVAAFGGWPIAASLAVSLLRRGTSPSDVVSRLRDGIAAVAGSVLRDLAYAERSLLIEMALMASYGVRPSPGHLAVLRRLGFPESATGPHEVVVNALLEHVEPAERAATASALLLDYDQPAATFALLAGEAPETLTERSWDLLPALYDRYDRETLERLLSTASVGQMAAMAARCFLLAVESQFAEASAIAERIIDAVAGHSAEVALRLARVMLVGGRGDSAVPALRGLQPEAAPSQVLKECLLGSILDERERFAAAMDTAARSGDLETMAIAAIYAAYRAARAGDLDDAEGFAAKGEDAARASGSVLQQARALKIRYGVAMLRADLDLAAVHAGRLTTLQAVVSDPSERATDLASALEVEVLAGRAARAAAFDEAIRRAGHGWLDMETFVVCRAIMEAWDGRLLQAADRLAAFSSLVDTPANRPLPSALGAFLAAAAGAPERADDMLRSLSIRNSAGAVDQFALAHYEMATSFAAMTEILLGRGRRAAARLATDAKTPFGALFVSSARVFAGGAGAEAYAEFMRRAGFDGVARMAEACDLESPRRLLSPTELLILSYLAAGMDAAHIARLTGRSIHTVKNQRRSIGEKLGAGTTIEAIAIARRIGLLSQ